MNRSLLTAVILIAAACCLAACNNSSKTRKTSPDAVRVIFETDMGNDIDDALALDMLYKYQDEGRIRLLAISSNKNSEYSVPFLDIMNTWYGYPDIPLGKVFNGADSEGDSRNYAQAVCEYTVGGKKVFKGSVEDYDKIPESVTLYRKLLAKQPDSSVVLASVGFSTNIARLLDSKADDYSKLNGRDLVARKVKVLCAMAGSFNGEAEGGEYNVIKDIAAARKVFAEWPTPIVVSPFEVGTAILYPASSIENDFDWAPEHPLVIAYRSYLEMPYDRPTWDLTAVLYAVEGNSNNYFSISEPGKVTVDDKGHTHFRKDPAGEHVYLSVNAQQAAKIKDRFIEIVTKKPKKLSIK